MSLPHLPLPTGVLPGPSSDGHIACSPLSSGEPGNNFIRRAPVTTSERRPVSSEITFLSRCFTVARDDAGRRIVLRKGKRHCWHEVRDARLATAVLAGLETAVVS